MKNFTGEVAGVEKKKDDSFFNAFLECEKMASAILITVMGPSFLGRKKKTMTVALIPFLECEKMTLIGGDVMRPYFLGGLK